MWAARNINQWQEEGKIIYPMMKELHDYKKKTLIDC